MLKEKLDALLLKESKRLRTLQFAMELPEQGFTYSFSDAAPDQRFHSASVGKLLTATLLFRAMEQGRIRGDDPVRPLLAPGTLDGLFVLDGRDGQEDVTVLQLLTHTSGVNDYFESKALDGSSFIDRVLGEPDALWQPGDLLAYTRTRQRPVGRPGERFFYSDTGYVILGLVAESVYGMPFHEALKEQVLTPAGMKDTLVCFHSPGFDREALAPLIVQGVDVHRYNSLSCDWAGGGLSTTTADLLRFLAQLQQGALLENASLARMGEIHSRYRQGLWYGAGMMQVRFEEFFFLLRNLPRLLGHLGVTGVHAWFDPETGARYVLNVGDAGEMARSFRLLIKVLQLVGQEKTKR